MSTLKIYRNLKFKDWHHPFGKTEESYYERNREPCSCAYGKHGMGQLYLDYKDPHNLKDIFGIKKGTQVLILSNDILEDEFIITRGEFLCVEFLDSIRILLRPERNPNTSWKCVWLNLIRLIAILPEEIETDFFEKKGTKENFIDNLSSMLKIKKEEVEVYIKALERENIPLGLKINTETFFRDASSKGILVAGWPFSNENPSTREQIQELTFVEEN